MTPSEALTALKQVISQAEANKKAIATLRRRVTALERELNGESAPDDPPDASPPTSEPDEDRGIFG